jgi:anti-sigma regulatory factor (Ser/Thr protein kinase)
MAVRLKARSAGVDGHDTFAYHLARGTWRPLAETEACFVSVSTSKAPAAARAAARDLLGGRLTPSQVDDALLVVSELVTNAVRHAPRGADARVTLHLGRTGRCLRGEMCDDGPGFDVVLQRPAPTDPGGRGLLLVDTLVSRWGTSVADGHCVWFETDL